MAKFEGSSDQSASDSTNKINEHCYKTPENFSCAVGLDSAPNFPSSSMGLKREVRVRRVFVREKKLQGTAIMYNNMIVCLSTLIAQYASRMKKANKCTEIELTPLRLRHCIITSDHHQSHGVMLCSDRHMFL